MARVEGAVLPGGPMGVSGVDLPMEARTDVREHRERMEAKRAARQSAGAISAMLAARPAPPPPVPVVEDVVLAGVPPLMAAEVVASLALDRGDDGTQVVGDPLPGDVDADELAEQPGPEAEPDDEPELERPEDDGEPDEAVPETQARRPGRPPRPLTPAVTQALVEAYLAGQGMTVIARERHLGVERVRAVLRDAGVETRQRGNGGRITAAAQRGEVPRTRAKSAPLSPEVVDRMAAAYHRGDSLGAIAAREHVRRERVREALVDAGLQIREKGHPGHPAPAVVVPEPAVVVPEPAVVVPEPAVTEDEPPAERPVMPPVPIPTGDTTAPWPRPARHRADPDAPPPAPAHARDLALDLAVFLDLAEHVLTLGRRLQASLDTHPTQEPTP